jgi:hypothetical protein
MLIKESISQQWKRHIREFQSTTDLEVEQAFEFRELIFNPK